jgi:hypothetical protein
LIGKFIFDHISGFSQGLPIPFRHISGFTRGLPIAKRETRVV